MAAALTHMGDVSALGLAYSDRTGTRMERQAMSFECKPLNGGIGQEVVGLDLENGIDAATAAALKAAWLEHGVLVFRRAGTSSEVQLELSRCFGELDLHPIEKLRLPGYPELISLSNENGPISPIYEVNGINQTQCIPWHVDLSFTVTPNAGALLRMVRKPQDGGLTGFLDTAGAYDALDDATKDEIAELEAVHLWRNGLEEMRFNKQNVKRVSPFGTFPEFPTVAHPLVWTHPETGRKVLNVSTMNIDHIVGQKNEQGDALLRRLIEHALDPRFQYIHDWEENDMLLWDNRRAMHAAFGHPVDQIRIVHRTTIKGGVAMGRIYEEGNLAVVSA